MAQDEELRILFDSFCSYGTRQVSVELDGAKFTKLWRDCKLIDGKTLTTTDVDLIFAKVKAKGTRKINFRQFEQAIEMIGEKKKISPEALKRIMLDAEGPRTNATKASYVKFHDDKNMYTGVYRRRSISGSEDPEAQDATSPQPPDTIIRFDKLPISAGKGFKS